MAWNVQRTQADDEDADPRPRANRVELDLDGIVERIQDLRRARSDALDRIPSIG